MRNNITGLVNKNLAGETLSLDVMLDTPKFGPAQHRQNNKTNE